MMQALVRLDTAPHVKHVIIINERRGKGVKDDPARLVTVVYTLDGAFIAEHDTWPAQGRPTMQ